MISPTWYPNNRYLRQFAVISLFGFGLMGVMARFQFDLEVTPYVFWAIGGLTCCAGLASPRAILPVYTLLMAVAFPIGWLVSNVLLRVLFYVILTPVGLLSRLFGRDPLRLKRPNAETYWLEHSQRADAVSYYRQA
ncbi:MAG: SxtJ family membrane protein [Phycisphaerae bacterium]